MPVKPELVVVNTPSYQPFAARAHDILQRAHDALAFIEMESMDLHYQVDERLSSDKFDFEKHPYFDDLTDEEKDGLYKMRDTAILENTALEGLSRKLHDIVNALTNALGKVENYQ
tara:strand:+ start:160 stop:504 length:345 start_codon:yes stop_codon:yes gene_type:complete